MHRHSMIMAVLAIALQNINQQLDGLKDALTAGVLIQGFQDFQLLSPDRVVVQGLQQWPGVALPAQADQPDLITVTRPRSQ